MKSTIIFRIIVFIFLFLILGLAVFTGTWMYFHPQRANCTSVIAVKRVNYRPCAKNLTSISKNASRSSSETNNSPETTSADFAKSQPVTPPLTSRTPDSMSRKILLLNNSASGNKSETLSNKTTSTTSSSSTNTPDPLNKRLSSKAEDSRTPLPPTDNSASASSSSTLPNENTSTTSTSATNNSSELTTPLKTNNDMLSQHADDGSKNHGVPLMNNIVSGNSSITVSVENTSSTNSPDPEDVKHTTTPLSTKPTGQINSRFDTKGEEPRTTSMPTTTIASGNEPINFSDMLHSTTSSSDIASVEPVKPLTATTTSAPTTRPTRTHVPLTVDEIWKALYDEVVTGNSLLENFVRH